MPRPRRALVAPLAPEPADTPAPLLASPPAAAEPEPAPAQPERTPERQRLATAIERLRAVEAEIIAAGAAVDEARRADLDASTIFYAAERAFDRAKPGYQAERPPADECLYEDWVREQSAPPMPIGEARAARDAAKDGKDTARRALEFHQERLDKLSDALGYRKTDVDKAAKAVAAADPAIAALVIEARRRYLAYSDVQRLVDAFAGDGLISRSTGWADPVSPLDNAAWPLTMAWRAVMAALATDADTPLPAV